MVPTNRPIVVRVEAIFETAKTRKLEYPSPDIDNLETGPLDQSNKLHKTEPTKSNWEGTAIFGADLPGHAFERARKPNTSKLKGAGRPRDVQGHHIRCAE